MSILGVNEEFGAGGLPSVIVRLAATRGCVLMLECGKKGKNEDEDLPPKRLGHSCRRRERAFVAVPA